MSTSTGFGPTPSAYLPSPPAFVLQHPYAGLGPRFLAALIDLLVLVAVTLLIALPFGFLFAAVALAGNYPALLINLLFGPLVAILIVVWILYFTYFEGTEGETLGKKVLHLKVVDVATGQPPSLGRAFVRTLLRIVDWLPALYFLGFVVAALTDRRQRLGDLLAGTVVVKA